MRKQLIIGLFLIIIMIISCSTISVAEEVIVNKYVIDEENSCIARIMPETNMEYFKQKVITEKSYFLSL